MREQEPQHRALTHVAALPDPGLRFTHRNLLGWCDGGACGTREQLALEDLATHPGTLRHESEVELTGDRVGRRTDSRQQLVERLAPMLHVAEPAAAVELEDLSLQHVDGVPQDRRERRRPTLLHDGIGILARRERGYAHAGAMPQEFVARTEGGAEPRGIAVVEQDCRRRHALEECGLLRREGGTEGCHHVIDPGEHQTEHVEVALPRR